ncbi:MAG: threonine/serine dehydratase [Propionibacteriales bacterium]|nr:threonine/serine dehydratase [Propionibacteriales bacterium]
MGSGAGFLTQGTKVKRVNETPLVTLVDIEAAAGRIAGAVRRTPLLSTQLGSIASPLWVKAEALQIGGSFKLRGATNAIAQLDSDQRALGVITHSSGNHAQAVARAARDVGIKATIVMPHQAPLVKREATKALGADIVLVDPADRVSTTAQIQAESGAVLISPYDDAAVIAGQGTVGLEIIEDLPDVVTVLVPVSGGGLISGIAVAVKAKRPQAHVIAVEPELAGDLAQGFAVGERAVWDSADTVRTIADGLRVTSVGELNWRHITTLVDQVVTVSEDAIRRAMRSVILDTKVVCEASGAVAVAGYDALRDALPAGPVVAVVSGGNVEPALLRDVLAGAAADQHDDLLARGPS